ncbi:MAG TPA: hypothetical protein VGC76_01745 [Pyrinomonadaceae bacterium]|jgi:hypothetical protein
MSKDLAIEVLNQPAANSMFDASGESFYTAIEPGESMIEALRWIMRFMTHDGGFSYVTIGGDSAIRRIASTGETFLTAFAQRIIDPYHYPLVRVFGTGSEEETRIFKRAFSAPWTLQMMNDKNNIYENANAVPPHHLHRHHRIERIIRNHSSRIQDITGNSSNRIRRIN